ncbi:MAG TPA: tRNA wybutosine-synthesizing 3 family protein [Candidatus Nanoarchaeia archaeon]|nr:tRNA wybutosine-synthesizing 3 family protein [Candidatus Nanoarchaeia archaeon]
MTFAHYKKTILSRIDKSNKGSIDKPIAGLITAINNNPAYCTTSSCSGRTVILKEPKSGKKNDAQFLYSTHGRITAAQLKAIRQLPDETLWFRFEPLILHVACDSPRSAQALLNSARSVCKHSGIISLGNHPVLEIRGSEFIEVPIAANKKLLVNENYLSILCKEANKKLEMTKERIQKIESKFKQK